MPGLAILLLAAMAAFAQTYSPGPQVLAFLSDVDDSDQPYGLYLPKDFSPAKKYPLVVSLHGAYSNHRTNLRRVFGKGNIPGERDAEATSYFPLFPDVDFIVVTPYSRGTMGYQGIAEKDVYDVLADVRRRFPIDEDRVYLTGLSIGGGGALWLGLTRPGVWAAIAAVGPAPPPGTEDLAANALNIPVHLFQGQADPVVPAASVRQWYKRLLDVETKVEYIEYPNVRHNSWDLAYKNGAIFGWFAKFRRNRFPERVRFSTFSFKYRSAYWLRVDGLTPGKLACIDARFIRQNHISVATRGSLNGFTIDAAGHPMIASVQRIVLTIDGKAVKLRKGALSFLKENGQWIQRGYAPPHGWKRPGAEGPASEVISGRHIYVYGTADSPSQDELTRRREIAARAAEWSTPRRRLLVTHAVLPDKDVNESTVNTAGAVLFGTRDTNLLIQRLSPNLPIELNPGAADYGLVMVVPAWGRTALVNSGLPFWTGQDRVKRPGLDFMAGPHTVLQSFGDFVLFKGSLENVVAEGRFEPNWKLPDAATVKMRETGAVTLR